MKKAASAPLRQADGIAVDIAGGGGGEASGRVSTLLALVGTVSVGVSFTAVTVRVTVAVVEAVPSVTVTVKASVPLKLAFG
ncbi:MAG: hypothetical protein R3E84_19450 [Pseudomonadales bacterium]